MLQFPSSEEEWMKIADDFHTQWQFPNCIGAINGRHIIIAMMPGIGSLYYNYDGTQSIVMVAVVDANHRFTYVDVDCKGRVSDRGILQDSTFGSTLFGDSGTNKLNIPCSISLPGRDRPVPFVFVGDNAFPLLNNLMKPFCTPGLSSDQKVFNDRLSHAQHVSEKAFSMFAHRFRVFRNPLNLCPSKIKKIVLSASVLHNYLAATADTDELFDNPEFDEDRYGIIPLQQNCNNHSTTAARDIRDEMMAYCVTDS